jgi:hypothetical protein
VITVPAPNRIGAAMFASEKMIADAMLRRIRILLYMEQKRVKILRHLENVSMKTDQSDFKIWR